MDHTILNYDSNQRNRIRQCFHALLIIFIVDLVVSVLGGVILDLLYVDDKISDIINFMFTIMQMVILYRLIEFDSRYRCAMIGWGISMVITIVMWFFPMNEENVIPGVILLVLGLIVELFGMYWLYQCHSRLVAPLDEDIAYRWTRLWYYECAGIVFVGLIPFFASASYQFSVMLLLIALGILIVKLKKEYDNLKASEKLFAA